MSKYLRSVPLFLSALLLVHAHPLRANELVGIFQDSVVFTNVGYSSGSTVISNFPLRVDISKARPYGFDYALAGDRADTLRFNFYDEFEQSSTTAVIDVTCNFSITNWNTEGVSTLYVAVPRFCDSPKARLTMYWNPVDYADPPVNLEILVPAAVTDPEQSAAWNQAIVDQSVNPDYLAHGPAYRRVKESGEWVQKLINYWIEEPTISKTLWKQGEGAAVITTGLAAFTHAAPVVEYIDRNTSQSLGEYQPLTPGAYRADVKIAEDEEHAELVKSLEFVIASAVDVGSDAGTNDFMYRVEFKLTDSIGDESLAADFNYLKTAEGTTEARSDYTYIEEMRATGEVSLGCWCRMDPEVWQKQPAGKGDKDKINIVCLTSNWACHGPLEIVFQNFPGRDPTLRVIGMCRDAEGGLSSAWFINENFPAMSDGQWHFLMATRSTITGDIRLYADGELLGTAYNTTEFVCNKGNALSIACDPYAVWGRCIEGDFIGQIAEVQVYDTIVSAERVKEMWDDRLRLTGVEDGLIAYFPLNDSQTPGEVAAGQVFSDKNQNEKGTHNITAKGPMRWITPDPSAPLPFRSSLDTLSGKPMLIHLSDNDPRGFTYDSLTFGKTEDDFYSDVRFFDENGDPLDYRIESWDPEGDSYVWVKVRRYNSATKVIMCWGQGAYTMLPENHPSKVWGSKTTEEEIQKMRDYWIGNYDKMIVVGEVVKDPTKRLQNRWIVPPSMTTTQWAPGETVPDVFGGESWGGLGQVTYWDRTTGQQIDVLPKTQVGEYRAEFFVPETENWSSLKSMLNFRIVVDIGSHALGDAYARALLANDDGSVEGGEVYGQSYNDNEDGWGVPYWTHHEEGSEEDVSDFDPTKLFAGYNLFAGAFHEFLSGTDRLWGLEHVRFGNLFNNGRHYPSERGDEGLRAEQNYLPWNPDSLRMLNDGLEVGEYHRYAGAFVMQNVGDSRLKRHAQICSSCYEDGIGTIYFDVVNAFTNNVRDADGNANYAIVVEVATNLMVTSAMSDPSRPPVDGIYPEGISSEYDYYFYADWQRLPMEALRFRADTGSVENDCELLPATNELELVVTDGGTRRNFYRVRVPVNYAGPARFRIRRTRIDESASFNPDADAFILVDNLVCSPAPGMYAFDPYGFFDHAKGGKQMLGQEMAFEPAFPGVGDAVYGRVRAIDRAGYDAPEGAITAVTMHYRWTYLNQARTEWAVSDFDPVSLRSVAPLVLPEGVPGDIEFWFEGSQNANYYAYSNYSGTKLGVPGYSESRTLITNRWCDVTENWYVRIREGRSNWEQAVLVVREPSGEIQRIKMALVDDHQWRGYYLTTNAIADGIDMRIEFRNYEESGATEWVENTNCCYLAAAKVTPPYSGRMTEHCGDGDWTHVPVDAVTGYLMFQADDSTKGLSVVRADYQNFNHWTDGHGELFIGTAADDSNLPASGTSPLTRDFYTEYTTNLTAFVSTNKQWNLDFESGGTAYEYYRTFAAGTKTVNGWPLGKGRFVYGLYRDANTGTAFQMAGCGEGYAEFSDQSEGLWPRGVEKVTFSARLAQAIEFDDFSYYELDTKRKNYCFKAIGTFDHENNVSFTGNASLSLVGYYRRGKGCYEARWEQYTAKIDEKTKVVQGWQPNGQVLNLYRWTRNQQGGYDQAHLFSITNGVFNDIFGFRFNMPSVGPRDSLRKGLPMSLSLYDYTTKDGTIGTMVVVGVCGMDGDEEKGVEDKDTWRYAAYLDGSESRLTSGSYGVLTANSAGWLAAPQIGNITSPQSLKWGTLTLPEVNKRTFTYTNEGDGHKAKNPFPGEIALGDCDKDLDVWVTIPGRNEVCMDGSLFCFRSADVMQTITLLAARTVGNRKFETELATYTLSNYWGQVKTTAAETDFGNELPSFWRTEDALLKFVTGGDLDGIRTDVVLDDVKVHQWRGRNEIVLYEKDGEENSPDNPNDSKKPTRTGDPDNFVYTSGWATQINTRDVRLEFSAKRTIPGRPCGVRTPLMDGYAGRGSGIGNIEFHYLDCQTNTVLLVQVATNVYRGNLVALTKNVEEGDGNGSWMTVARLTYDELGDAGSTNVTFGLRKGSNDNGCIARVIIDPELVKEAEGIEDPDAFGSIKFVRVICQDEPQIDKGCWWGWNIRTLGDSTDAEKRMYLPDASELPGVGYSLALNHSTTDQIVTSKKSEYPRHLPFLQSPSFTNENVIGEISFRARKYDHSAYAQYAEVAIYGITQDKLSKADDSDWTLLKRFIVSNTVFTTYSYRAIDDGRYSAIRLAVTGVKGVNGESRGPAPQCGSEPVRVLLDEVTICEAVMPQLAIRNLGAFRYDMMSAKAADNVPSRSQQPLCREGWGVQCELYAVMLEDQISTRHPPKVRLWWYEGSDVWGYTNWMSRTGAHSGWLARAEDTKAMIYRSSYDTAPDAVIPQSEKEGLYSPIVQFMVEIFYTIVDPKTGETAQKSRFVDVPGGEWTVPEWYSPIDYNTDPAYGKGENYSCFCILDDVAPGWAWINEVNILGDLDRWGYNTDRNCQYVEIAAPVTADISGWKIQLIQSCEWSGYIVTNTVAVFGKRGLSGTKEKNVTSNYVFHVVANPDTGDTSVDRSILEEDGALDGTWKIEDFNDYYLFFDDQTLSDYMPVGVRLLRPNGIVEHEILTIGEDVIGGSYDPSNVVKYLNSEMRPGGFFVPGYDENYGDHSVGVINGQGEDYTGNWNNTMMRTPGRINQDQQINGDIPMPYGEMAYIFSELDQSGGNIWQSGDGVNFTNETMRMFVKRDSEVGTNVIFRVEPWYEVESCRQVCGDTVTYFDVTSRFDRINRQVAVELGKGCNGTTKVVTRACVDRRLRDYDVDENNVYTPAIIRWLQDGTDAWGNPFLNDDGEIRLGEFWGRRSGYICDLTLTQMYWLDMDPTAGDMVLVGGWGKAPTPVVIPATEDHAACTNEKMSVFLMITNKTEDVESPLYAAAWSPYVLRSVDPGVTSWDYDSGSTCDWKSVTFKVKGVLLNEHTSLDNPENWVDLRWFVFHPDSFHQPDNELGAEPYTADIEVIDPVHRHDSPGYDAGWVDWVNDPEHPERAKMRPYYRWDINTRLKPKEIEVLKTNNVTIVSRP